MAGCLKPYKHGVGIVSTANISRLLTREIKTRYLCSCLVICRLDNTKHNNKRTVPIPHMVMAICFIGSVSNSNESELSRLLSCFCGVFKLCVSSEFVKTLLCSTVVSFVLLAVISVSPMLLLADFCNVKFGAFCDIAAGLFVAEESSSSR